MKNLFIYSLMVLWLTAGCAGIEKRNAVNLETGTVSEVTSDRDGNVTQREQLSLEMQQEWLRKVGIPEEIVAKVTAGEELSAKDKFILINRIKIFNSSKSVQDHSSYNGSLGSYTTVPGYRLGRR